MDEYPLTSLDVHQNFSSLLRAENGKIGEASLRKLEAELSSFAEHVDWQMSDNNNDDENNTTCEPNEVLNDEHDLSLIHI